MASWADLKDGKTRASILGGILSDLRDVGLRIDDWSIGAVVRVLLDIGFSGALSALWDGLSSATKGGFLRLAQELAEADIVDWTASPQDHWLYLLALNFYETTPKLSEFTVGTVRFFNGSTTAQTIGPEHVVKDSARELLYAPTSGGHALAAGATIYVEVKADQPGSAYNVGQAAIDTLTVSLPGVSVSNVPAPGASSWITTYGADTERPKELADRCSERWARLSLLQASPADAYKSLAKEAHSQVRKVAVWSNYSHATGTFARNVVTLYLGGLSGPVDPLVPPIVLAAMAPYIGLHDVLECQPCGTQTFTIRGTLYVKDAALIPAVRAAVEAALTEDEALLDIGQTVHAWRIRKVVAVKGVENFTETLADFVPAKNALVDYDYSALQYLVGT